MKHIFLALLLTVAVPIFAYNPIVAEPEQAYSVIAIEGDPYIQREYLGDLEDFPDMYELTSEVAFTLKVQLRQRSSDEPVPFGLIIVRQNEADGGVAEVARLNQPVEEWTKVKESALGMTFLESTLLEEEVEPGTYRIEVSTPDNKGNYMLIVGDESKPSGYFTALGQIFATQQHFSLSPLHIFLSSYVYYPLGIVLVLLGIFFTHRYYNRLKHVA